MNILLLNSEGPDSLGLSILQDLAAIRWPKDAIISLTTASPMLYQSGSMTKRVEAVSLKDLEEPRPFTYTLKGASPTDLVDLAFLKTELFLAPRKSWDLLVSGISPGEILGTDLLRASTSFAAMYAAASYQICSIALAQQLAPPIRSQSFGHPIARRSDYSCVQTFFREAIDDKVIPGDCWAFNFPIRKFAQGWRNTEPAHYSILRGS